MSFACVGFGSCAGAGVKGTGEAPLFLQKNLDSHFLSWDCIISESKDCDDKYENLSKMYQDLAEVTYRLATEHPFFFSFGGDHSMAIGTWSGVSEAYRSKGDIGLIWIDAHMDAHTPQTSESGNVHGMPLAHLMGYGDPRFSQILSNHPKIKPENTVLIGIRSYEKEERELLESLNTRIYYIDEVHQKGFVNVLDDVIKDLSSRTAGYGVSFDIDSIDPVYAKATGTPVANGIDGMDAIEAMNLFVQTPPIAFEFVEYNPLLDEDYVTFKYIQRLLHPILNSNLVEYVNQMVISG